MDLRAESSSLRSIDSIVTFLKWFFDAFEAANFNVRIVQWVKVLLS